MECQSLQTGCAELKAAEDGEYGKIDSRRSEVDRTILP